MSFSESALGAKTFGALSHDVSNVITVLNILEIRYMQFSWGSQRDFFKLSKKDLKISRRKFMHQLLKKYFTFFPKQQQRFFSCLKRQL